VVSRAASADAITLENACENVVVGCSIKAMMAQFCNRRFGKQQFDGEGA